METKTCYTCKQELSRTEFGPQKANKDGLNGRCRVCMTDYRRAYEAKNKEARQAWRDAYKKTKQAYDREYHQLNRGKHLEQMRRNTYAKRYNITIEEYEALFEAQDNACAICKATEGWRGKRLAVDHDHDSGEVRGLLCDRCNTVLGKMQDNPELLQSMIEYLKI